MDSTETNKEKEIENQEYLILEQEKSNRSIWYDQNKINKK